MTDTVEFVNTTATTWCLPRHPCHFQSADVRNPPMTSTSDCGPCHWILREILLVDQPVQFTIPNASIRYGGNYTAIYPPWLKNADDYDEC